MTPFEPAFRRVNVDPSRWERLRELLDLAMDHPDDRSRLLAQVRADDPRLCDDLEACISDAESSDTEENERPNRFVADRKIGPYRIIRELGRGGMSTVFLAVREADDVQVLVALKLMREDLFGEVSVGWQRRELQMLTRLDHPNIARVLDWGNLAGNVLYLAIEYVEGRTITQFATEKSMTARARLDLFLQVCAAVEHAHRNLIVHRDLKPANILVKENGQVKLLDFGIAAQIDSGIALTVVQTRMTPAYAAPEQLRGEPAGVATDVYALGVLLHELLTGRLPFEPGFCETEPALPSGVATLAGISRRELAGDLDNIILKALCREPAERYASVEQLTTDIRRYIEGRPVQASRGSRLYVMARFLRRNRANVALSVLGIFGLVAGGSVALWKWRAAERRYAELRQFAQAVISTTDERSARSDLKMQQQIATAAVRQLDQLRSEHLDDDLQTDIAAAYLRLADIQGQNNSANTGQTGLALANYEKAYGILASQWAKHPDLRRGHLLVECSQHYGYAIPDPARSASVMKQALAATREAAAKFPADLELQVEIGDAMSALGQRLRQSGDLAAALQMEQEADPIAARTAAAYPNSRGAFTVREVGLAEQSQCLRMEGRYGEALDAIRRAEQAAARADEIEHTTKTRRELAFKKLIEAETLRKMGQAREALPITQDAVNSLSAIAFADASNQQAKLDLAQGLYRLGDVLSDVLKIPESIEAHQRALDLRWQQVRLRNPADLQATRAFMTSLNRVANLLLENRRDPDTTLTYFAEVIAAEPRFKSQAPSDAYALAEVARAWRGEAAIAATTDLSRARFCIEQSLKLWARVLAMAPLDIELAHDAEEAQNFRSKLRP